ncbi:J domain-containing protein [Parathalassolituus penaei]|uniref:J domain-containing protein n=1 Tax=Parathalassolituus penaei TaxID=2997323 RepID=A0A9X3ISW2_9GAMM|nr:J domain-containing protein [Parathalassolituus penaei]MCY0965289.1 J domain-containing protein [Parathalassolituus penaei]
MNLQPHLAVLGLDADASRQQVRERYRKLVMFYHPDRNPAGIEQFRAIRQAYEFLLAAGIPDREEEAVERAHAQAASLSGVQQQATQSTPESQQEQQQAKPEAEPAGNLYQLNSERRRNRRRGTPGDRRFEFIMEDQYKGTQVRILV